MKKLLLATIVFVSSFPVLAEARLNIKVKNIPIGSYFILFDESLESNNRVGLIGQSYFGDKGVFVVNNGFKAGSKVIGIIVKDKFSGDVILNENLIASVDGGTHKSIKFYDWIIEYGVYGK